jgi:hypothetical protein
MRLVPLVGAMGAAAAIAVRTVGQHQPGQRHPPLPTQPDGNPAVAHAQRLQSHDQTFRVAGPRSQSGLVGSGGVSRSRWR